MDTPQRFARWKWPSGILTAILWSFLAAFWKLEKYVGLAGTYDDLGWWKQTIVAISRIIPVWVYENTGFLSGIAFAIAIVFVIAVLEKRWTEWWASFRYLLARLKEAIQKIGWVKVRYGIVQQKQSEKDELRLVLCPYPQSNSLRTRMVWKGRVVELVVPRVYDNHCLFFLELPATYRVTFPHSIDPAWRGHDSEDRPGYYEYTKHNIINRSDPTDMTPYVFSVLIVTAAEGTAGWYAAWRSIRRGFKWIFTGGVTIEDT